MSSNLRLEVTPPSNLPMLQCCTMGCNDSTNLSLAFSRQSPLCAIDSRINHPSQSQIGIGLGYPLPPMKFLSCAAKSVSPEKSEVSWNDRRIVNSMQMCVWNILDLFFFCRVSMLYIIYTINKLSNIYKYLLFDVESKTASRYDILLGKL